MNSKAEKNSSSYLLRVVGSAEEYPIPEGVTRIGRAPACDITLTDAATGVSRMHAEIRRNSNVLELEDSNSRNHTFLNGSDIYGLGPQRLNLGDCVSICQFEFRLVNPEIPSPESGCCKVDTVGSNEPLDYSSLDLSSGSLGKGQSDERLSALISISRSLGSVLDTEAVLRTSLHALLTVFPDAERCVIGYLDESGNFEAKWWKLRRDAPDSVIEVSQRIVDKIRETGEALLFTNAVDAFPEPGGSVYAMNLRSIMCAPLADAKGQTFGVLQMDSSGVSKFDEHDLELFASAAVQIALALSFAKMHNTLVEEALLLQDVEQARSVQKQFLPSTAPQFANYEFADFYAPARQLGGDYFDYIPLRDGRVAVVLGDVVGKGVPAALNMVQLATETRATFEITQDPSKVMDRLNKRIRDAFITCAIAVLDPKTHVVSMANAGHELPLKASACGEIIDLCDEITGVPLSVIEDFQYEEVTFSIGRKEMLVMLSDGFIDAENTDEDRHFGRQRVRDILARNSESPRAFADALVHDVRQFVQESNQFDDMCLVCFQRQM